MRPSPVNLSGHLDFARCLTRPQTTYLWHKLAASSPQQPVWVGKSSAGGRYPCGEFSVQQEPPDCRLFSGESGRRWGQPWPLRAVGLICSSTFVGWQLLTAPSTSNPLLILVRLRGRPWLSRKMILSRLSLPQPSRFRCTLHVASTKSSSSLFCWEGCRPQNRCRRDHSSCHREGVCLWFSRALIRKPLEQNTTVCFRIAWLHFPWPLPLSPY